MAEQKGTHVASRKSRWNLQAPYITPHNSTAPTKDNCHLHEHKVIDQSYIARWKENFDNLNIPQQDYFSLLITWVQSAGCDHDHKFISNCLDFIDSKAQVISLYLAPNLCHYLPDLYNFLVRQLNKPTSNEATARGPN